MKIKFREKGFIKTVISLIFIFFYASVLLSHEEIAQTIPDRSSVCLDLNVNSHILEDMISDENLMKPAVLEKEERESQKEINPIPSDSRNFSMKFGLSYFIPSEQSFKNAYKGGLAFGGEMNLELWKFMDLWLTGTYYSRKGSLPVTGEDTTMTLIPIGIGGKIRFHKGKNIPYLGIGPVIFVYKEENPIGVAKGTRLGIISQAGCLFKICGGLLFDIFFNYSYCAVTPQKIKANLGGIQVGLGLDYEFR